MSDGGDNGKLPKQTCMGIFPVRCSCISSVVGISRRKKLPVHRKGGVGELLAQTVLENGHVVLSGVHLKMFTTTIGPEDNLVKGACQLVLEEEKLQAPLNIGQGLCDCLIAGPLGDKVKVNTGGLEH